jgi:hypothetical protein
MTNEAALKRRKRNRIDEDWVTCQTNVMNFRFILAKLGVMKMSNSFSVSWSDWIRRHRV